MKPPPVRYFRQVMDLMRLPTHKRNAAWWFAVRAARDSVLEVLRAEPDPIVIAILLQRNDIPKSIMDDARWRASQWRNGLAAIEAWSEKLDHAYFRYALERSGGLAGSA